MAFQFVISSVAGSAAYWWDCQQTSNGQGSALWGFIVGLAAAWLATFLIVWARTGWRAACSVSLFG